jgi:two-component system heavy metal sensor histidine kinase CusS
MFSKSRRDAAAGSRLRSTGSLAARLTAWYAGSAFVLLAAATAFLYWALVTSLDREDDEFLVDKISILQTILQQHPRDSHMLKEEVEWEPGARQFSQVFVRVMDVTGTTILETPEMGQLLPPRLFPAAGNPSHPATADIEADRSSYRVGSATVPTGLPGSEPATIHVALDRTREEALLARYRHALWIALALALVVCAVVGYQIAHRGLRPLATITAAADQIGSGTLHQRLYLDGLPAELSTLAATFNEMLNRLQESFDRLGRFSADIAHELRTPINNLRGEIEVGLGRPRTPEEYRELLTSNLEECGRLAHLIDNLLFLARAEHPATQVVRERVDLGRELCKIREFHDAAATEAGVKLTTTVAGDAAARVDRTLFQRAVANLIANALAHTPPGGVIALSVARDGDAVHVEVSDTGTGIAPEHVPHVWDRFYRADPARSAGNGRIGLGLAIVKSIATLHGGSVAIDSAIGQGTRVSVVFPVEQKTSE